VRHKNFKAFREALKQRLKVLGKSTDAHVVVGVVKNKKHARSTGKGEAKKAQKATNAQIATVHEYGSKTVPARPFLRPTVDKQKKEVAKIIEKAFKKAIKDGTEKPFLLTLSLVGQKVKDAVFKYITTGPTIPPPLSPKTIAARTGKGKRKKKGGPRPLVDTGQMARSITFEVRKK
jgi:HK97 gp10 family phage protein